MKMYIRINGMPARAPVRCHKRVSTIPHIAVTQGRRVFRKGSPPLHFPQFFFETLSF